MAAPVESLFCEACASYAHPFLEACPACGIPRRSRFEDALATARLGFRALLAEPHVTGAVREAVLRYSIKLSGSSTASEVRDGFGVVADSLPYSVQLVGAHPATSGRAHLELAADDLVIRERNPSREVGRVPLGGILAVQPPGTGGRSAGGWLGIVAFGRPVPDDLPAVAGDLVVTFGGPALGRLAVSNRRGFAVPRARPDHYALTARWLGYIAAAAAEDRWCAIGPAAHAAEILLHPPGSWPAPGLPDTGSPAAPQVRPPSLADSLAALEELLARGLVSQDEYTRKRNEILARL
jgi:hypothetical protein